MDPISAISEFASIPLTIGNIIATERTNKANRELAAQANQWSIDQWNRENAYNDPKAQMERLRQAGINPALAYANGGLMNEAASSPAVTSAAGSLRAFQVDPMMMAQISLLNAQKNKTDAETDSITQKLPEEIQNLKAQRENVEANTKKLLQDTESIKEYMLNLSQERRESEQRIVQMSFERSMRSQEFQLACKQAYDAARRIEQEIVESKSRVNLNMEQIQQIRSITRLNEQQFEYNVEAMALQLIGLNLDNQLKQKTGIIYDDQHALNDLQKILLGYDVALGWRTADAAERWRLGNELPGLESVPYQMLNNLFNAAEILISPIKGFLQFKIK